MESTSNFAIFHFSIDESIEVVPTNWIDEGKFCWYPKEGSKLNVRNSSNRRIEVTEDFVKFDGRIIGNFDTYSDGRKKLPEAQYNSDLDTSKKPRLDVSASRPALPLPPALGLVDHVYLESSKTISNLVPISMSTVVTSTNAVPLNSVAYSIAEQEIPLTPTPLSQVIAEDAYHAPSGCTNSCAEFCRNVLRKLVTIQETQRVQSEMLEAILNRGTPTKKTYAFGQGFFPISKMDDLEAFNQLIKENRDAYQALVHRLTFDGVGVTEKALK